jgi:hypothetical protein
MWKKTVEAYFKIVTVICLQDFRKTIRQHWGNWSPNRESHPEPPTKLSSELTARSYLLFSILNYSVTFLEYVPFDDVKNWRGCGRKRPWHYLGMCLEEWEKPRKISVSTSGVSAEILTGYFQNKSQKHYHLSQLSRSMTFGRIRRIHCMRTSRQKTGPQGRVYWVLWDNGVCIVRAHISHTAFYISIRATEPS